MGRIDETLECARSRVRESLPSCFALVSVDLAFGFRETDSFVVDISYRRASAHLEPWGWEGGLVQRLRELYPPSVWIGLREVIEPSARGVDHLDGQWIILDED